MQASKQEVTEVVLLCNKTGPCIRQLVRQCLAHHMKNFNQNTIYWDTNAMLTTIAFLCFIQMS